jgi:diaminopimelate decarboxylase
MAALPAVARDAAPDPTFPELLALRPHLTMDPLAGLMMEEVPLARIAAEVGSPTWVYSAGALRRRLGALQSALSDVRLPAEVHFAVKANPSLAVLRVLAAAGHIVFSGVGKTLAEIRLALDQDIQQINAESAEEVEMISAVASAMGRTARVALRVNPDVDAKTHAKITTGKSENKFGVAIGEAPALYARMAALPGIQPVGVAVHIGSQITSGVSAYRVAYGHLADLVRQLRAAGLPVDRVDCGGGLGIPYRDEPAPSPAALAGAIQATLGNLGVELMLEPGRWIAGPAGVLLSSVILQKQGAARRFVVLDAAMNDLIRPAMYEAWHGIVPVAPAAFTAATAPADVVGPVCESGDTFCRDRGLPQLEPGSLVAILDAGAYGAAMSSTYNNRPLAAEVLVDGDRFAVVRPRQTHEQLLAGQHLPPWMAA